MIDIYVWEDINGTTWYTKIERCITDVTIVPPGLPPDASLISANDWFSMVPESELDINGLPLKTFEQREEEFIALLGWTKTIN